LNVFENKKALMRLIEAVEKQRCQLSANAEGNINLDYLMEDCDFSVST
jgi:molecular chaperone DnaK (HSP70)